MEKRGCVSWKEGYIFSGAGEKKEEGGDRPIKLSPVLLRSFRGGEKGRKEKKKGGSGIGREGEKTTAFRMRGGKKKIQGDFPGPSLRERSLVSKGGGGNKNPRGEKNPRWPQRDKELKHLLLSRTIRGE